MVVKSDHSQNSKCLVGIRSIDVGFAEFSQIVCAVQRDKLSLSFVYRILSFKPSLHPQSRIETMFQTSIILSDSTTSLQCSFSQLD